MNYDAAIQKLAPIKQTQLLDYWRQLNVSQQESLLSQINNLDIHLFTQQQLLINEQQTPQFTIDPFTAFSYAGNRDDSLHGQSLIAKGQVGCLIVAGGQGSRLHFDGPKGMFPITPVTNKSLFQLFAEKTIAAGKRAGRLLDIAIMTSPLNHKTTVDFFEQHDLFGLKPEQISFFSQETLPFLDVQKNLFLESVDTIANGPDGNGCALESFHKSGIWQRWHSQGIRFVNFILIDNPLADPFDAELIGFHDRTKSDVVIKCTKRISEDEKVGSIAETNGRVVVIEYSEMPKEALMERNANGTFSHLCANLSLFSFSMDFVKRVTTNPSFTMPLHKAFKAVNFLNTQGNTAASEKPNGWKFEKFIFDLLPQATKVTALLYPRDQCFAPLKNFSGDNSPSTVKKALENNDRRIWASLTGKPSTIEPFELAQEYHYPKNDSACG